MASKVKFELGAVWENLDRDDLRHELDRHWNQIMAEKARGVKPLRFSGSGTIASSAVTIPSAPAGVISQLAIPPIGPTAGNLWAVQRVSIHGLTTSTDTVSAYRGSTDAQNFLFNLTGATPWYHAGGKGLLLYGGEQLNLAGSSLSSTGQLVINGEAIEVPEPMVYKVL